jgi:hypothetical protein
MSRKEHASLKLLAERRGCTMSRYIRSLVRKELKKKGLPHDVF